MRLFLTAILLLIINISFSQTVEELEYELSYYKSGESWGNKKEQASKLLELDGINAKAINYLVEFYGRNNQKDSIRLLFDRIIKNNPNNPEPYLIRVRNRNPHFEGLTYTQQINFLKEAKKLDCTNTEATYMLGKLYYELFIRENDKTKKKVNLDYYAANSIRYFSDLCEQKESLKETLKFPLLQLVNYLGDTVKKDLYKSYNVQASYFPVSAFVDLPNDWETNYSINVIDFVSGSDFNYSGIESAIFRISWYSEHLVALEEPILSDALPTKILRFIYLRTFDNPIVIGLENSNDTITIYWKVSDGSGGYEPGKIIENKSKELTVKDWERIENTINSINFWSLPKVEKGLSGEDGSQWILEGKTLDKYQVVDRWCGGIVSSVCKDLIELTDLKIKEDDIY